MSRIEICFQIDEDDLVEGLIHLRNAAGQWSDEDAKRAALRVLNRVGGADRFPVMPGDEDGLDERYDDDEEEEEP